MDLNVRHNPVRRQHDEETPAVPAATVTNLPTPAAAAEDGPLRPLPRLARQNAFNERRGAGMDIAPPLGRSPLLDRRQESTQRLQVLGERVRVDASTPAPLSAEPSVEPESTAGAQAASTSAAIVARQSVYPRVSDRLREKFEAIELPKLRKLDKDLYEYACLAVKQASTGWETNGQIMNMDQRLLPLLADMENHRNPGLNLHVFKSDEECRQAILEKQREAERDQRPLDMRIVYPPFSRLPDHRVALDVKLKPGERPSVIYYESAPMLTTDSGLRTLAGALGGAQVHLILTNGQRSEFDCAMFSLNAALKSFKTGNAFASKIHDGESLPPGAFMTPEQSGTRAAQRLPLPPEFMKHTQSETSAERNTNINATVTKAKTGDEAETLTQRIEAYRAIRATGVHSTSIEGFRLQEILRAGEYLQAKRPPKKSWFRF